MGLGLACCAWLARAQTGVTELPGLAGDGPVTVFYPSPGTNRPVQRGPLTLQLNEGGAIGPVNGRLVVVSHGSGANPWVFSDLARTLSDAGFVVAFPQHRGDHTGDVSDAGPVSWRRRPAEVSRAIDALAQRPEWAARLRLDRVGLYGGSAGGHTVLAFAGGRWSGARMVAHCEHHIAQDFAGCAGFTTRLRGNVLDGPKQWAILNILRLRFNDPTDITAQDPRIAAAVAAVPYAADFDLESLRQPRIPLGLVRAGRDAMLAPRLHGDAVAAVCQRCERLADLPTAGHGMILSPLPSWPAGSVAAGLLSDPPGFDRRSLPMVHAVITDFFQRHLLP